MFWIDRTAYPLGAGNWNPIAAAVRAQRGIPFIVSSRTLPLTPVLEDPPEGVVVYSPKGHDLAGFSAPVPVNLNLNLKTVEDPSDRANDPPSARDRTISPSHPIASP
jgi:hypothetical protein